MGRRAVYGAFGVSRNGLDALPSRLGRRIGAEIDVEARAVYRRIATEIEGR